MNKVPAEIWATIAHHLQAAPVNIDAIANGLGLQIFESELGSGISGALVRDATYQTPSGFVIFVNSDEAYVRQRFTAAHEIGHFVLHKDSIGQRVEDNYLLRAEGLSNAVEAQANKFASDILMPYPLIEALVQEGVDGVDALAKRLQVSQVAMAIRLGHPT
jgi:Zn-dependent peptidase ImmA (M78 family)